MADAVEGHENTVRSRGRIITNLRFTDDTNG